MGRDTTASKRMAEKRCREKAAGLRRLNVAMMPEVFDKLASLMKRFNCASQAKLIEHLIMDLSTAYPDGTSKGKSKKIRNEVTVGRGKTVPVTQPQRRSTSQKKKAQAKKISSKKTKLVAPPKEPVPSQLSLF